MKQELSHPGTQYQKGKGEGNMKRKEAFQVSQNSFNTFLIHS